MKLYAARSAYIVYVSPSLYGTGTAARAIGRGSAIRLMPQLAVIIRTRSVCEHLEIQSSSLVISWQDVGDPMVISQCAMSCRSTLRTNTSASYGENG